MLSGTWLFVSSSMLSDQYVPRHDMLELTLRNGQRNPVGAKTAVARYFGKALQKSKKITTTNWSLPRLSESQILYAADDAHVALRVYRLWRENPVPAFPL